MGNNTKRFVITGVSRGLGRALVDALVQQGHIVCGCARSREVVEQFNVHYREPHHFHAVDVGVDMQVRNWARTVIAAHGAPDFLVNNAALMHEPGSFWEIAAGEFSRVIDVNVKGTANVIRHFLPSMLLRRTGMIVNISSGWGRSVDPYVSGYCASKWAVEGLTKALAEELPPGLGAVAVNPGIINTDMLRRCFGASAETYPGPEAWAERAVPFLLGLDASMNGESLTIA
jgi:NAD(P)-dependent dehydrogenase (short-subunit alcohol dehydrogenase family)